MRPAGKGTPRNLLLSLRRLSDGELVAKVKKLAARERQATAMLVAHLAELDTRDVHLREGYSSLFSYCREVLALSEHEAYNRIEVARAVRRFPVVLDLLEAGSVNLTAVRLLAPHLTLENHETVLESARGKRKVAVAEIVAGLSPWPDVPMSVRKVPTPRSTKTGDGAPKGYRGLPASPAPDTSSTSVPPSARATVPLPGPASSELTPLSEDRYRLRVTIAGDTVEKLRLAKDMLRHALPSGDDAAILDRALTALLTDLARKKFSATEKPRRSPGVSAGSRHIPAEVRRAVWVRDLGRCAFKAKTGHRCGERAFIEFHHRRPYAVGGKPKVDNIELRCRRHNNYESKVFFARDPGSGAAIVFREPLAAGRGEAPTRSRTSWRSGVAPLRAPTGPRMSYTSTAGAVPTCRAEKRVRDGVDAAEVGEPADSPPTSCRNRTAKAVRDTDTLAVRGAGRTPSGCG